MSPQIIRPALLVALIASGFIALAAQPAGAQDMKRKPGLWETKSTVMGMTNSVKQCVGPGSDDLMMQMQRDKQKVDCSAPDVRLANGGYTFHTVCKASGRTITTDGTITGSLDSAFKGKMVTQIDPPPQAGMGKTEITMESRWAGPCTAGQKPGDMVMSTPSGAAINLNDPRIQEMMKRAQQAQGGQQ